MGIPSSSIPARYRQGVPTKPSKYRNVRTVVDGINFHSKREAARYSELCAAQRGGLCWFTRQPVFDTGGGTTYRADFLIVWLHFEGSVQSVVVEDVKGMRTAAYRRSKRQVEAKYGIEIVEV